MSDHILTQNYLHSIFEYKDGELYWKKSLSIRTFVGQKAGYTGRYKSTRINKKLYLNHRLIFLMHYGYLPKFIDHIDENKHNNRIENLRIANTSQNMTNIGLLKTNTSGCKNVFWNKILNKWQVHLRANGKTKYIGCFDDLELADLVAQEARDKYHGMFARHK